MGNCLHTLIKSSNDINESYLVNSTYDNTKDFSLENLIQNVRIVDIYDGDTCTCIMNLYNNKYKFHIRLAEIDTCEIKSKNIENKNLAIKARNRLFELVTNINLYENISRKDMRDQLNKKCYLIKLKCGKFDKYGRLLGHLYSINNSDLSYNQILIKEKLAYYYDGGTKLDETKQYENLT
jgi:endonuclease YncB( thermonuclease family)